MNPINKNCKHIRCKGFVKFANFRYLKSKFAIEFLKLFDGITGFRQCFFGGSFQSNQNIFNDQLISFGKVSMQSLQGILVGIEAGYFLYKGHSLIHIP